VTSGRFGTDNDEPGFTGYPGAQRPARRRRVDSHGVRLAVYEWGAPDAPPILCTHGGFDFAATWDLLAPLLAAAGWRVVAWDQRGHGDSDKAALYSWDADIRDLVAVLDSTTDGALPLVGHSKGGGMILHLADALPQRVSHVVNIDGLPSRRRMPDVSEHERSRLLAADLEGWLDHRRAAGLAERRPGSLRQLAERRQKMNPRLPMAWLLYIAQIGALEDDDGWRWKLDPTFRFGGFGPVRPEWAMLKMAGLPMPLLGLLGLDVETMSWGTLPQDVEPYLPAGARFLPLPDTGHFIHIERPDEVAAAITDFVGAPRRFPVGINAAVV
jgi:pimeloyl-ACP methyl ester carboxylesterase